MIGYVAKSDSYIAASTDDIDSLALQCFEGTKLYLYDTKTTKIQHDGKFYDYIISSGGGGDMNIEDGSITTEKFAEDAKVPFASEADSVKSVTVDKISDASAVGKSILSATNAATVRSAIGAGTSNLALGTTASTAKKGNYVPTWDDVTNKPTIIAAGADATSARSVIGAGTGNSNLAVGSTVGTSLATTANAGTSAQAARADHVHPFPTAANVGAAASSHTHTIANVTGLQSALDGKLTATKASAVTDSEATDIEGVNTVLNNLLANLRTAGILE